MSLVTITSPTHAFAPKVWWEGDCLHARTSLAVQTIALGTVRKEVIVDPHAREVVVRTRTAWFFPSERVVPFDAISHVAYGYGSLVTSFNIFGHAHDSLESFSVGLALHDRDEIHLFSFSGGGAKATGAMGVMLGDDLVDVQGDQQGKSLSYVDALMELTGKGLSKHSKPYKYRRP
jgi:hypothetical protein